MDDTQSSYFYSSPQITSTFSAFFGQVQDIAFLPGGDEFVSAAEVVKRNSTDKGIMVWDFRSTAVLSNQIYQVCLQYGGTVD